MFLLSLQVLQKGRKELLAMSRKNNKNLKLNLEIKRNDVNYVQLYEQHKTTKRRRNGSSSNCMVFSRFSIFNLLKYLVQSLQTVTVSFALSENERLQSFCCS